MSSLGKAMWAQCRGNFQMIFEDNHMLATAAHCTNSSLRHQRRRRSRRPATTA